MSLGQKLRGFWCAEFLSPSDLIRRALVILVIFAVVHGFGLREYTSVLNGTTGSLDLSWETAAALGVTYIFLYLVAILLVPMLLLAAGIAAIAHKLIPRKVVHEPVRETAVTH